MSIQSVTQTQKLHKTQVGLEQKIYNLISV